jgi:hypothetical protein
MSYFTADTPLCAESLGAVDLVIRPSRRDLGEFSVARALPASERQMVGPFIFFDHMGPADFGPGQGIQVRPHPHIGIATITYLFEGLVVHRDSLGYTQPIEPGAVNLMVAGAGIVHSERAGEDLDRPSRLNGIQTWLALPDAELEREPGFTHYPADRIPDFEVEAVGVRLIIGEAFGCVSPVLRFVDTQYMELRMPAGRAITIPVSVPELAVYVASGSIDIDNERLEAGVMAVAGRVRELTLSAASESRVMVLGGAPVGERLLWWNFVAPSQQRIEQAKADWQGGRFPRIAGDAEFIPLPED